MVRIFSNKIQCLQFIGCTFQETISPRSFQLIIQTTPTPPPPPLEIAIAFTFAAEGKQLKVLLQRLPHVTLRLNVNILGKLFHKSFHFKYLFLPLHTNSSDLD